MAAKVVEEIDLTLKNLRLEEVIKHAIAYWSMIIDSVFILKVFIIKFHKIRNSFQKWYYSITNQRVLVIW